MKTLFYSLLLLGFTNTFAQDISFEIATTGILKNKMSKTTYDTKIIGKDKNFNYFICFPFNYVYSENGIGYTSNFFVEKCDNSLNKIQKSAIDLEYKGKERHFEGIFINDEQFLLFSSFQNLKQKKHYLFVQNMNRENLQIMDSLKLIDEIDFSEQNKYLKTNFNFSFSVDKSKILIFYNLVNKDNEIMKYRMCAYDNKMNLIWKNDNIFSQPTEGYFQYENLSIDNEGNAYALGKTYKNKKECNTAIVYKNGIFAEDSYYTYLANYEYTLFKYNQNTQSSATITIPEKFISSLAFKCGVNNKIFCAGIYASPGTISAKGCFTLNLDIKTNKISNLITKEFGENITNNILNEKELNNFRKSENNDKEWDPYDYQLSNIKTRENGDKYLIAQQFMKGERRQSSYSSSGSSTHYYPTFSYNNLLVINIDKNNKIGSIMKIEKHQYSMVNDLHSSYFAMEKNNNLYFVFMDIIRKNSFFKNYSCENTFLVKLEAFDKQNRVVLKNTEKDSKMIILPQSFIRNDQGDIIYSLISSLGTKYEYEKLKIKE